MLGLCGKVGTQLTEALVGKWVFGDLERGKWGFRISHVKMAQGGHDDFAAGTCQKECRYMVLDCASEVGYG